MAKTYNTISTFTSGQILTATQMNGIGTNVNNYRVPPLCVLDKTADQTVPNGTVTALTFAAGDEIVDTDDMHSGTSNTSRITINTAGIYTFNASVIWAAAPAGLSNIFIRIGGTDYRAGQDISTAVSASVSWSGSLTVGQYVEATCYHSHGSDRTVDRGYFSATWMGQAS